MENQHCGKPLIEIHIICTGSVNAFGCVCSSCGYAYFNTITTELDVSKVSSEPQKLFPEKEIIEKIKNNFSSDNGHDLHKIIDDTLKGLYPHGCEVEIDDPEKIIPHNTQLFWSADITMF
ncbi:hypothetical protein HF289_10535 [Acidithiobacillus ferrooxidans]|uniref:hypothetical protein n=1 Tax=Acidithiobacillus ferrooxidans TaxID=920 RepID=UPI001C06CC7B|nr:hypothetical protein [Acidithiobacillus ferrooxidans]MBU2857288.1 hypothetical protein [Acidithiobacillus ferrooxidans]